MVSPSKSVILFAKHNVKVTARQAKTAHSKARTHTRAHAHTTAYVCRKVLLAKIASATHLQ